MPNSTNKLDLIYEVTKTWTFEEFYNHSITQLNLTPPKETDPTNKAAWIIKFWLFLKNYPESYSPFIEYEMMVNNALREEIEAVCELPTIRDYASILLEEW